MTDLKVIDSIFPKYRAIYALPFKDVDTISGEFLGKRALTRYKILDAKGEEHTIVLKRKNGLVVPFGAMALSPNFGIFLKVIYAHHIFGFNDGQKREKLFYENIDNALRVSLPHFLGTRASLGEWNIVLIMNELPRGRSAGFNDLRWIIDVITSFHARYFGKKRVVQRMDLNQYRPKDYRRARKTLRALFDYYYDENVKIYGQELIGEVSGFIDHIDEEYAKVMDRQTLTHNDLTSRNILMNGRKVIIYDWELACFQNPEHDLVELLFTMVDDECTEVQIRRAIMYFRAQITEKTQLKISDEKFAKVLRFNALEYCVNRLAIYRSYCKKHKSEHIERCERNIHKVLEVCL